MHYLTTMLKLAASYLTAKCLLDQLFALYCFVDQCWWSNEASLWQPIENRKGVFGACSAKNSVEAWERLPYAFSANWVNLPNCNLQNQGVQKLFDQGWLYVHLKMRSRSKLLLLVENLFLEVFSSRRSGTVFKSLSLLNQNDDIMRKLLTLLRVSCRGPKSE